MKFRTLALLGAAGFTLGAQPALAQEEGGDDLELTMTLMPEDGDPSAVTRELTLPVFPGTEDPIPSDEGVANSATGLSIANQARTDGEAFGRAAADAAETNRELYGRGSRRPEDVPMGPPVDPGTVPVDPPPVDPPVDPGNPGGPPIDPPGPPGG